MNNREYSKKTWIITAVMAAAAMIMDLVILMIPRYTVLRETSVITLVIAGYILIVSIKKIIEKTKQEKDGRDQ